MPQKLTKLEAAARLDVSQSTIDRMIQRGELQIEKEPRGSRYRVWVVMGDEVCESSGDASHDKSCESSDQPRDATAHEDADSSDTSVTNELAVLRERVKSLEELADYHRGLIKDSEWRYQQAMEQLGVSQRTVESLTKALPAANGGDHARPRWSWWPFGRRKP